MIEINLHPRRDERTKKRGGGGGFKLPEWGGFGSLSAIGDEPWRAACFGSALLVVAGVLGLWLLQRAEADRLETQLAEATRDSTRFAELRALNDSLTARQENIRERIGLIEDLDQNRFIWPHLMNEVSGALPNNTWLTGMKRASGLPDLSVQLMGVAASPLLITEFVRGLESSPHIGKVRIVSSKRQTSDGARGHRFVLVVHYTSAGVDDVRTTPLLAGGF